MQMAIEEGRITRPNLEVGICGEHGGDPESIEWCHLIGNNYVSCSPFRVPIARLAAGQAALKYRPHNTQKPKASRAKPAAKRARPRIKTGKKPRRTNRR
jgi:pyruvate,orthophosphate dikinase